MASLCPFSAAASFPSPRAACFRSPTSWSGFAATASNGYCCGCGVLATKGCARLRSRWRNPVCTKIDEADKDKGAGFGFRPPDRKKLRPRLRLLWWRIRRLSPRDLTSDAVAALRRAVRRVPPAAAAPVVLALLLLAARFALPKNVAREVAYSDLVVGFHEGAIVSVAFEEDSRRIYFTLQQCWKREEEEKKGRGRRTMFTDF